LTIILIYYYAYQPFRSLRFNAITTKISAFHHHDQSVH